MAHAAGETLDLHRRRPVACRPDHLGVSYALSRSPLLIRNGLLLRAVGRLYSTLSRRPHTAHERPVADLLRPPVNLKHGLGFDERDHSGSHAGAPPASWL